MSDPREPFRFIKLTSDDVSDLLAILADEQLRATAAMSDEKSPDILRQSAKRWSGRLMRLSRKVAE